METNAEFTDVEILLFNIKQAYGSLGGWQEIYKMEIAEKRFFNNFDEFC
jgi:hypothetical protein